MILQRLYRKIDMTEGDYYRFGQQTEVVERRDADVVTSEIAGSRLHAPVFDLDIPHWYAPSGTAGHGHLYIEMPVTWRAYKRVLRAMWRAGIIERGFYRATLARGYGSLRLPEKPKVPLR